MKNNDLVERFKLKGQKMNETDKQLIDDGESLWAFYKGTGGSVGRESSQRRALEEVSSGKLALRQRQVLEVLEPLYNGVTYAAVGRALNLHHGQSSSALSNLHRAGLVFQLNELRDGCHPYVHYLHRDKYPPEQRIDNPSETLAGKQKRLHQDLWDACSDAVATNFGREACMRIKELIQNG
jgi:hypothetical protein